MYKIINKKKLLFVRAADLIGRAIFSLKKKLQSEQIVSLHIKKILIIRLAYLGDAVMTLPVLRPLHDHFPEAKISFLTCSPAAELLRGNPYIDKFFSYDAFWFYSKGTIPAVKEYFHMLKELRKEAFDLVLDFRGDIRNIFLIAFLSNAPYRISYEAGGGGCLLSSIVPFLTVKHKVEYHLDIIRFLGITVRKWNWDIYLDPAELQEVEATIKDMDIESEKPIIGIHPGARKPLKCWDPEKFALLADKIIEKYSANVIFFGAPHETELIENVRSSMKNASLSMAGKTSLRQMAAAIRYCRLFIGNDSAPIHIAAAQKISTLAIFGPSKSNETSPYGDMHRVVEVENMPCRASCDEDKCLSKRYKECMSLISPEKVFLIVEPLLCSQIS